eukprot:g13392.t1
MFPDPDLVNWVNCNLGIIPYNARICKQHAVETAQLFNNKKFIPEDFKYSNNNKTAKVFDAYWDQSPDNNKKIKITPYTTGKTSGFLGTKDVNSILKDPDRERYVKFYKKNKKLKNKWNESVERGANNLTNVYNSMKRKGVSEKSKQEIADIFIYSFLANAVYAYEPFSCLENPMKYEEEMFALIKSGDDFSPKLTTKLAMQQRCLMNLPNFKSIKPLGGRFSGLLGGRKLKIETGTKTYDGFRALQALWKKHIMSSEKTPLDEQLQDAYGPSMKPKNDKGDSKKEGIQKIDIPTYCLGYNDHRREIVIMIRGTYSIGDALTEMVCFAMLSACGKGRVHGQMQLSAILIAMTIHKILTEKMSSGKYDKITVVGHSLGAGTASLLGILLNTPLKLGGAGFEDKVRVFGYGTPPVICDIEDKGTFMSDTNKFIVTIINQHDLITRLATQNMSAYVWCCNNSNFMDEWSGDASAAEKKDKPKKKSSMFGNMAKAGADAALKASRAAAAKGIELAQKGVDAILKVATGGRGADFDFKNMWLPGRVNSIAYEYNGITEFIKNKAQGTEKMHLKDPYVVDGTKSPIEVEKKNMLCLHEVPRNHPRVTRCVMDVRCLLDHMMPNYLRHLAELYEKTPGKDVLL